MGWIAGIFYYDQRALSPQGDALESLTIQGPKGPSPAVFTAPGILSLAEKAEHCSVSATGNCCTWDGRLDNGADLRKRFGDGVKNSPAALALAAFETLGTDGLREPVGDWSASIWDSASRSLVLASDFAGVRPLYYYRKQGCAMWSSSLASLVLRAGVQELDDEYIAGFLATGIAAEGRTPYRGVFSCPAGGFVRISARGVTSGRFWSPSAVEDIRYQVEGDYQQGLLQHLRDAVRVRMGSGDSVCSELSGGMDSSTIVCIASRLIAEQSVQVNKLVAFSYHQAGSPDEPYIRVMEQFGGFSPVHLNVGEDWAVGAKQAGKSAPLYWEPRLTEVKRQMAEAGSEVLLTGQLGDLIMGNWQNDSDQVAQHLVRGKLRSATAEAFAWSRALHRPVYTIFWRALQMALGRELQATPIDSLNLLAPEFKKKLQGGSDSLPQTTWLRDIAPDKRTLFGLTDQMLRARALQCPEMLQQFSYTHPYAHRPLVEYMLGIPAGVVCRPGVPRQLMRQALSGLMPDAILKRMSKASYGATYFRSFRPLAAEMLQQPRAIQLVQRGYLDGGRIQSHLQRFLFGMECHEPQLRNLMLLEYWLRGRDGIQLAA